MKYERPAWIMFLTISVLTANYYRIERNYAEEHHPCTIGRAAHDASLDQPKIISGIGPCRNDEPIPHHSTCLDGNTLYVIPPFTGWADHGLGGPVTYFRANQPCGMYRNAGAAWLVAFDSDTAPINHYRTEREARHAVEEGCKP